MKSVDDKLRTIADLWKDCEACGLSRTRANVVFWRGNCNAKLAFVGEAPGELEDREGYPFVGKAGQLLDELCEKAGVEPWDTFVCNIIGCRPPGNRKPEPEELEACRGRVASMLGVVRPKALLLLGGSALQFFTSLNGVTKWRGKQVKAKVPWCGKALEFDAVVTFHPSYLLRAGGKEGYLASNQVVADIREALGLAQGSYLESD